MKRIFIAVVVVFLCGICSTLSAEQIVPFPNFPVICPVRGAEPSFFESTRLDIRPFTETIAVSSISIEQAKTNDRIVGILVNILYPGVGSLIIGNTAGGVIALVGNILSNVVVIGGLIFSVPLSLWTGMNLPTTLLVFCGGGEAASLGFLLFSIISSLTYVDYKYSQMSQ